MPVCQVPSEAGHAIVGYTRSFGAGEDDLWLIKTNALGETLWSKTYGLEWWDEGCSIIQTADGGYLVLGRTEPALNTPPDFWLLRTDTNGDTLWTRRYGGVNGEEWGCEIKPTTDSNYVLVGFTGSYGAGAWDVWLIKINADGDTLWTRTYGGPSYEEGAAVVQADEGGYVIVGCTESYGAGQDDLWIVKADSSGDTLWTKAYGGVGNDWGSDIVKANDGGYIIVGTTESFGTGSEDIWLLKIDSLGDTLWTKTIGNISPTSYESAHSIIQTIDGGYDLAGYSGEFVWPDGYFLKTDSSGNILWSRLIGGSEFDGLTNIRQTSDGGFIIIGYTYSFGSGDADLWLVKTAPDTFNIVENQITRPWLLNLEISPNPARSFCRINYELAQGCEINISLYDITGRAVKALKVGRQNAGHHVMMIDMQDLPSAVYFIRFSLGEESFTKKIILAK
jgi:hypothetical protein